MNPPNLYDFSTDYNLVKRVFEDYEHYEGKAATLNALFDICLDFENRLEHYGNLMGSYQSDLVNTMKLSYDSLLHDFYHCILKSKWRAQLLGKWHKQRFADLNPVALLLEESFVRV
ncbi:MAG: hypothetical protein ACPGXL_04560 [Chitinophagales bacterium]